jgi:hypothetical protein
LLGQRREHDGSASYAALPCRAARRTVASLTAGPAATSETGSGAAISAVAARSAGATDITESGGGTTVAAAAPNPAAPAGSGAALDSSPTRRTRAVAGTPDSPKPAESAATALPTIPAGLPAGSRFQRVCAIGPGSAVGAVAPDSPSPTGTTVPTTALAVEDHQDVPGAFDSTATARTPDASGAPPAAAGAVCAGQRPVGTEGTRAAGAARPADAAGPGVATETEQPRTIATVATVATRAPSSTVMAWVSGAEPVRTAFSDRAGPSAPARSTAPYQREHGSTPTVAAVRSGAACPTGAAVAEQQSPAAAVTAGHTWAHAGATATAVADDARRAAIATVVATTAVAHHPGVAAGAGALRAGLRCPGVAVAGDQAAVGVCGRTVAEEDSDDLPDRAGPLHGRPRSRGLRETASRSMRNGCSRTGFDPRPLSPGHRARIRRIHRAGLGGRDSGTGDRRTDPQCQGQCADPAHASGGFPSRHVGAPSDRVRQDRKGFRENMIPNPGDQRGQLRPVQRLP